MGKEKWGWGAKAGQVLIGERPGAECGTCCHSQDGGVKLVSAEALGGVR